MNFVSIDIPSENFKLPKAEAEACRIQRISYESEGKRDQADKMFIRERRALREEKIRKEFMKIGFGSWRRVKTLRSEFWRSLKTFDYRFN